MGDERISGQPLSETQGDSLIDAVKSVDGFGGLDFEQQEAVVSFVGSFKRAVETGDLSILKEAGAELDCLYVMAGLRVEVAAAVARQIYLTKSDHDRLIPEEPVEEVIRRKAHSREDV